MNDDLPEIVYVIRFYDENGNVVGCENDTATEANISNDSGVFFEAVRVEGMWWWSSSDLYEHPAEGTPCGDGHATMEELADAAGEHCGAKFVHDTD